MVLAAGAVHLSGFGTEISGGHGSHTAGTAAGVMLDSPAELTGCSADEELGCVGGCFESTDLDEMAANDEVDLSTLCPAQDCDGWGGSALPCLANDPVETLTTHGGLAPGAKIAVFDVVAEDGLLVWASLALNGLWDAVEDTGCKVHSNSWAGEAICQVDYMSVEFDGYMYEVGLRNTPRVGKGIARIGREFYRCSSIRRTRYGACLSTICGGATNTL